MSYLINRVIGNRASGWTPSGGGGGGPTIDFYVSTSGGTGAGTIGDPWSLNHARTGAGGALTANKTVALRAGTYTGQFDFTVDGASGQPIKFINYPGEDVVLDSGTGGSTYGVLITGDYLWFQGGVGGGDLRITRSDTSPPDAERHGAQNGTAPVGCKVINCVLDNHLGNGISVFAGATNFEGYGNLMFCNGRGFLSGNYAYGIYSQNTAPSTKEYNDNIAVHNFGNYPFHIYAGGTGLLESMTFRRNICQGGWNLFGGGDPFENLTLGGGVGNGNVFYSGSFSAGALDIGYQADGAEFGFGTNNAVVTHNYILKSKTGIHSVRTGMTCTDNLFNGDLSGFTSGTFPSNTYVSSPTDASDFTLVLPNSYETGRGHVFIWNGIAEANSVNVDVSTILQNGDNYEIQDAQNYYGSALHTGTYGGGTIAFNTNSTAVVTANSVPAGRSAPVHSNKEFNVYVVRKV